MLRPLTLSNVSVGLLRGDQAQVGCGLSPWGRARWAPSERALAAAFAAGRVTRPRGASSLWPGAHLRARTASDGAPHRFLAQDEISFAAFYVIIILVIYLWLISYR